MTVLNEEGHLAESVASILAQDWPGPIQMIIAVGPSTDRTAAIAEGLASDDRRVRLVGNPGGRTPAGLNRALAAADHDVIVRADGHCVLPPDYVSTALEVLDRTGADNVGGVMAAAGVAPFERAVAVAMTSKLGVGSAAFHVGGEEGPAETVYLGVFRREAIERVGGYDDQFERAQDWEMNHRIRASGGVVWFTPELSVTYRPRASIPGLARQYFNYGRWRRRVMATHRSTIQARYLAAPAAVLVMGAGSAAGVVGVVGGSPALRLGWAAPLGYAAAIIVGGLAVGRAEPWRVRALVPAALATMHCSWGAGFLTGMRSR